MASTKSRKKLLGKSRLYVIIDKKITAGNSILDTAVKIINSGADILQLRDKCSDKESIVKNAFLLQRLLSNRGKLFIVNDYLDVAKIADCDGLHLGQSDISIELARKILGNDKIIGLSCHSLRQALLAEEKGADYIGIGPVFPTLTKPEYNAIGPDIIGQLKKRIRIPFFPIGGINQQSIGRLISSGAKRAAVCSAILQAEKIPPSVKYFSKILH